MKKIIAILVPIICLLLLFVIVLNTVILPKQRREAAIEQYGEDFVVKFEILTDPTGKIVKISKLYSVPNHDF